MVNISFVKCWPGWLMISLQKTRSGVTYVIDPIIHPLLAKSEPCREKYVPGFMVVRNELSMLHSGVRRKLCRPITDASPLSQ